MSTLSWQTEPGKLELIWTESGSTRVTPPESRGYGSRAIVAGIERQLGGLVKFDWHANGLCCTLFVPHEANADSSKRALQARQIEAEAVADSGILIPTTNAYCLSRTSRSYR